jgi:4-hydroxybenzoate polyprenyltransferase
VDWYALLLSVWALLGVACLHVVYAVALEKDRQHGLATSAKRNDNRGLLILFVVWIVVSACVLL